jgi:hypothetical protein
VVKKPKAREEKKEAPLPLPEKVEMQVYMHCKECTLKVKKILKRFNGNVTISSQAAYSLPILCLLDH